MGTPHEPARKVTFEDIQEVRRLARNPEIGAFRVMAALEQIEIKLSQRTCGRLLQLNRNLNGLEKPKLDEWVLYWKAPSYAPRQRRYLPGLHSIPR